MDIFIENFYSYLIKYQNFYMIQYYSNIREENRYVCVKNTGEKLFCVVITTQEMENIDICEVNDYFTNNDKKFSLNVIILGDHEYISTNILNNIDRIVIDRKNYKLIHAKSMDNPLIHIIERVNRKVRLSPRNIKDKYLKDKISTLVIIFINIIFFILSSYFINKNISNISSNLGIGGSDIPVNILNTVKNSVLISMGAKYLPLIQQGEFWRVLTCAFLHSNFIHISCNMYMLYVLGPQVEKIYGVVNYISIYLISAVISTLFSIFINPNSISVGASGAIFGLMGMLLSFAIVKRNKINKEYISGLIKTIFLNLFIGLVVINIDNAAHLGGLVSGVILSYIVCKLNFIKIKI